MENQTQSSTHCLTPTNSQICPFIPLVSCHHSLCGRHLSLSDVVPLTPTSSLFSSQVGYVLSFFSLKLGHQLNGTYKLEEIGKLKDKSSGICIRNGEVGDLATLQRVFSVQFTSEANFWHPIEEQREEK